MWLPGNGIGQTDNVANIVNPSYFAAIPGASGFNTVDHCGACIKITNGGKSIVATIIDECPTDNGGNPACTSTGHLDISWKAWSDLGYSVGNPSGTTWQYVPCGITAGIVVRFKSNNNNQEIYIENVNIPVKSVSSSSAGTASRTSYGTWHFNSALASGSTLTLTGTSGATVTITLTSTAADSNVQYSQQFPSCT